MELTIVAGPFGGVTEGPAWDGERLLFTHIPTSRILAYDPATRLTSIARTGTNWCNGTMFDTQGRHYGCEGGARRVVRYDGDDAAVVLSDSFEGRRYNIPNDLAIDGAGRIWFTDPFYEGAGGPWSEDRSQMDLDHESVYRLDPDGGGGYSTARVTFDTTRPNGLLFNLDHSVLYVAQSGRRPDEDRQLRAYPVRADGSLGDGEVLHDFGAWRGIDGMVLDTEGNIWATAGTTEGGPGPRVYVFSPSGEVIARHRVPADNPTNCTFAGPDLSELYVTTIDGYLLWGRTGATGRLWYPAAAR